MRTIALLLLAAAASAVTAAVCPATVLVTHPFADPEKVPNQCGRMMSVLSLAANGTLTLQNTIEVGWCPSRVRLSPTGDLAIVVLDDNHGGKEPITQSVVAYRRVVNSTSCSYQFKEIARFDQQFNDHAPNDITYIYGKYGNMIYISDTNIPGEGGIHTLKVNADETNVVYASFVLLPFAAIMRVISTPTADRPYIAVLGGEKPADIVIVDASTSSLTVVFNMTLFDGAIGEPQSMATDAASHWLIVPDASPFDANLLQALEVVWPASPSQPPSLRVACQVPLQETTGVAISLDGKSVLASQFSQNVVTWLSFDSVTGNLTIGDSIPHMGLADRSVQVNRGDDATRGLILISSVTDIVTFRFTTGGTAGLQRITTYSFPDAIESLVGDISVQGNDYT